MDPLHMDIKELQAGCLAYWEGDLSLMAKLFVIQYKQWAVVSTQM